MDVAGLTKVFFRRSNIQQQQRRVSLLKAGVKRFRRYIRSLFHWSSVDEDDQSKKYAERKNDEGNVSAVVDQWVIPYLGKYNQTADDRQGEAANTLWVSGALISSSRIHVHGTGGVRDGVA